MRTSTAYDLSRFAPEPRRQPNVRVVKTTKKKTDSKRAFKVRSTVFVLVLMLLMATTVYSRLQLTETRTQINNKTAELTELESENTYLNFQLESKVSLKNAEEYAVSELGLVKLSSSQIEYVSLNSGNSIEVLDEGGGVWAFLTNCYRSVVAFLGGETD